MDPYSDELSKAVSLRAHASTDQPFRSELRFVSKDAAIAAAMASLQEARLKCSEGFHFALEEAISDKVNFNEAFGVFQHRVDERDGHVYFCVTLPTSDAILKFLIERSSAACLSTQLIIQS